VGGAIKGVVDLLEERKGKKVDDSELSSGGLFATGLVAGGALLGVIVALLNIPESTAAALKTLSIEESLTHALGHGGYQVLGVLGFALMGIFLFRAARKALPDL
jgi:hypothetical protein